jgi:hypothetical protein
MRALMIRAVLLTALSLPAAALPLLCVAPVRALPDPPARPPARKRLSVEEISVMLSSSEENELRSALEASALLPAREVLPLLDERVRAGLPRMLLDVAIDSLLLIADRGAGPLLVDLASHRRPEVRVRALEALGRVKSPAAEPTLTRALGDLDPNVRKSAAAGLAELGLHGSFGALARALERGVEGAPRALGRVAKSDDVGRLLEFLGTVSLPTLTPMFEALLARKEISEAAKLSSVEKIAGLGGDDARGELQALLAQLPREASPRLRRALTEAAQGGASE